MTLRGVVFFVFFFLFLILLLFTCMPIQADPIKKERSGVVT